MINNVVTSSKGVGLSLIRVINCFIFWEYRGVFSTSNIAVSRLEAVKLKYRGIFSTSNIAVSRLEAVKLKYRARYIQYI